MQQRRLFPIAPMAGYIAALTYVLLAIPIAMLIWGPIFVAGILVAIYALVWFWFRPSGFELTDQALIIRWPLRTKSIPRENLESARIISAAEFRAEHGWAVRVGAGGLWGGFGYVWTKKEMVEMYVSGTKTMVLINVSRGRNLLISPQDAAQFVALIQ